jgi:hypothetical protein
VLGVSKVWLKLALFLRLPDLKLPSSAATVCVALSWLVQVTVSPALIVMVFSLNKNPLISTSKTFPDGTGAEFVVIISTGTVVGSLVTIGSVITGAEVATSGEVLLGAHAASREARVNIVKRELIFI